MRPDIRPTPLAALGLCLVLAAPATARADAPSPAQEIATALESSPVVVDPAYDSAFPEETRARVEETIEDSGLPVRVILVPLVDGDTWGGDPGNLATAVHDRVGGAGHYLVLDSPRLSGSDFDASGAVSYSDRAHYAALAASYATDYDAPLSELVEVAVDAAVSNDPEAVYEREMRAYEEEQGDDSQDAPPAPEDGTAAADGAERAAGTAWLPWAVGGVAVLLLLGGGYLLWTRPRAVPALRQHAAFDNVDQAHRETLERRAGQELVELGERLGAMEHRSAAEAEALRGALDAHAAARAIHDRLDGGSLADVVGVLVLLDLAEERMARRGRGGLRRRHCYANPLHGTDTRPTDWRQTGSRRAVRVPLCGTCAKAVRARMRPNALPVEHGDRTVPYFEVPAEESVWAATGFGTLTDDLVERIQRGDHR
ncbi:hypothetical protein KIK06_11310 [Nocardiopsis sp. EMB25]|uniref:hypothetical protein n=1 Tax=Nocardiopsis sp. EMB25 TaxID=2835867 RepID=UPI002283CAAC|nr:hypothetical protein [Nocardiopsis sp. EMB25]MCY9784479.1 hypothetical protein [Nocardiopsis sp. EMB25]